MMQEQEAAATRERFQRLLDLSILGTIAGAAVTHAMDFGIRAAVAGALIMVLAFALQRIRKAGGNRLSDGFYKLFNILVITGFGVADGFWNHLIKTVLYHLHNSRMPPLLSGLFLQPLPGSLLQETAGILTFVAAMSAAYAIYRIMQR